MCTFDSIDCSHNLPCHLSLHLSTFIISSNCCGHFLSWWQWCCGWRFAWISTTTFNTTPVWSIRRFFIFENLPESMTGHITPNLFVCCAWGTFMTLLNDCVTQWKFLFWLRILSKETWKMLFCVAYGPYKCCWLIKNQYSAFWKKRQSSVHELKSIVVTRIDFAKIDL